MIPYRLRAARLIDADRPYRAAALLQDIAANPANVIRHFLVAYLCGACGRCLQVLRRPPAAPAKDHVGVHHAPSFWEPCLTDFTHNAAVRPNRSLHAIVRMSRSPWNLVAASK